MNLKIKNYSENGGVSVYYKDTPQCYYIPVEFEEKFTTTYCEEFKTQFGCLDCGNDKKTFFRLSLPQSQHIKFIPKFNENGEFCAIEGLIETYDNNCTCGMAFSEIGQLLQNM